MFQIEIQQRQDKFYLRVIEDDTVYSEIEITADQATSLSCQTGKNVEIVL